MNKTKVIATVGPASEDKEVMRKMFLAGIDVIRINLSYADEKFCMDVLNKVDSLNKELEMNVATMFDTKGPSVKIGKFADGKARFKKGDKIRIYMYEILGDQTKFSVDYPDLVFDVKTNHVIKVDDGKVCFKVLEKDNSSILCEVLTTGVLESGKSLIVPDAKLRMPFLSAIDKRNIELASKMNVDFLALSHVSGVDDILEVNDLLIGLDNDHLSMIAKIENESAYEEIDDIIRLCDGIMIARGDLGVSLPMERVPGIQKAIINKCHNVGKISIVATEMLSSMETVERPTRAEVSDIAGAVLSGVDAVMLSGETTTGKYPIETIEMMNRIISTAEMDINYLELLDRAMRTESQDTTGSIAYSVADCANRLRCKAIVAPTMSGYTARKMSRFRPSCPIIAITPSILTARSLALYFGIHAVVSDEAYSFENIMNMSKVISKKVIPVVEGDHIIITGGYPFKEVKHTNFMKIEEF